jgi:hypothetical protein
MDALARKANYPNVLDNLNDGRAAREACIIRPWIDKVAHSTYEENS